MKQIKQFRYYHTKASNNYPNAEVTQANIVSGNIFAGHGDITHLGIQAIPGTKFYLNNSYDHPIIIGFTGIYELQLNSLGTIYAIKFDLTNLNELYTSDDQRILIDIIYEGGK